MNGQQQGYPAGPGYQQQGEQEVPDFLALAFDQLGKARVIVDRMANADGADQEKILGYRFKLAEDLTALADIQYSVPDDSESDEDLEAQGGIR